MTWNVRKLISPPFQCTSITNRVLSLFDRFTTYYNCMTWNVRKTHISAISAQVSQIVFLAYLTVLRLITTVWPEMSGKLISPTFQCTSITNRVLSLFDLVLRLITTVWPEMSENSYLHHFSAQVSQIVFFAYLTVLQPYYNCMTWNVRKLISPPFQCTSITKRFLSLFDRLFTIVWPEMS